MEKLNINLDKYVQDFYLGDINLENARIFSDEDENNSVFINQFLTSHNLCLSN